MTTTARTPGKMSRRGQGGGPTAYDFRRPIKLSREHVRTLQIAFETYARSCGTLLTTRLRAVSNVSLISIEQLNYDEYVASLANPTIIGVVALDPLPGTVLIEIAQSAVMTAIDHMLGGPGGSQPERPLTEVEMPLLRGLIERMLGELRYGFESLVDIQPHLKEIEYNAQFLRAHAPGDAVVVASFETKIGAEECISTICLPFNTILPVLSRQEAVVLSAAERQVKDKALRNLTAGLSAAPIDVAVRFQPIRMRTDDIVDLRPGDVVPLGHPTSRPLEVTVNDIVFAHAVPGNQGARLACLVVPSPTENESKESGRS
ncbi:flagellar motor switch protein FliM [Actinoplanes sp. SE50]|uniref:flagellar motor switch protein FliM n=1 Tax=unclassified Actinoplanes TaxID=2626549 RepID=UPI00023EDEF8|nr:MULTISPECIES: flagellar motor switch protein FliM [unclassified Actinoplanes]AEV88799.1 Flagellar motor switch protein fliM [Actinoplanes sp. SE50/110]ATO87205.1 flagellar motor switch protein FliM [Actinoplanes sp. SE50]SLM04623.1 flagellar motor switch protein FliM [Actinoplanes sp. SE50/110]